MSTLIRAIALLLVFSPFISEVFAACTTCKSRTSFDDIIITENIKVSAAQPKSEAKSPVKPHKKQATLKAKAKDIKKLEKELDESLKVAATEAEVINKLQHKEKSHSDDTKASDKLFDKVNKSVKHNEQKVKVIESIIKESRETELKNKDQMRLYQETINDYQQEMESMRDIITKQNDIINKISENNVAMAQKIEQDSHRIDDNIVTLNQYGKVINKQTASLQSYGEAINTQARQLEKNTEKFEQLDALNSDHQLRFRDIEGKAVDTRSMISQQMERIANLESHLARRYTSLAQTQQDVTQRQQSFVQQQLAPMARPMNRQPYYYAANPVGNGCPPQGQPGR